MAIERADVLYPLNSTTIDSGASWDVRLLSAAQAGTTDSDQSVRFTHTQDGQERTFDPDNALVTVETDPLTFQGEGWALRAVEDMTPADDTNCNALLKSGTLAVNVRALLSMNAGTNVGGSTVITFRASLWIYNTVSHSGTLIASGSQAQTWDTSTLGGENNTRKNTAISIAVASNVEFQNARILMLQVGCEGTTLPNATLGTTNFDVTLDVDDSATNIDFAAGQGIRQFCAFANTLDGRGTTGESGKAITQPRSVTGRGSATESRAVVASKTFGLVGKGTVSHTKAVAEDFDLVGKGIPSFTRAVIAAKGFNLTGKGEITRNLAVALSRSAIGKGTVTSTKGAVVAKSFDLVGKGLITEIHPVQAFRTFGLTGKGSVDGRIELPIDEVPGDGAAPVIKRPLYIFDD